MSNLKAELKELLKELVEKKVSTTRERREFKRNTPVGTAGREGTIQGYWEDGRATKESIRHLSLAYAFVRGQAYWTVERVTRNAPSADLISRWCGVSVQAAKEWLDVRPSADEIKAWNEHLFAAWSRLDAMKAERLRQRGAAA